MRTLQGNERGQLSLVQPGNHIPLILPIEKVGARIAWNFRGREVAVFEFAIPIIDSVEVRNASGKRLDWFAIGIVNHLPWGEGSDLALAARQINQEQHSGTRQRKKFPYSHERLRF